MTAIHLREAGPAVPVTLDAEQARRDPRVWREDLLGLTDMERLAPSMAAALWRQADRALRPGLLQGYRTVDETSIVLRGRLRSSDQMSRQLGQVLPLENRHDEYTVDIPENRILATEIRRMLRVPGVDAQSRRMLRHLSAKLVGVTELRAGERPPRWQPSRLNARYLVALRLAELVLAGSAVEAGVGAVVSNGFLLDMPSVFEDFLSVALRHAIEPRYGGAVALQSPGHVDVGRRIALRPDIVWSVGGTVQAVVDAKYKAHTPAADAYQMLAYCTVHNLDRGHLVYVTGNHSATTRVVRTAGTRIICHALDLNQPPEALLAWIRVLATEIVGSVSLPVRARPRPAGPTPNPACRPARPRPGRRCPPGQRP